MKKAYLPFIIISLLSVMTYGQDTISENDQFINKFELASDYTDDGDYHRAIAIYSGLLEEQPDNYNLNFKMGYCLLNTVLRKSEAVKYLEKASNGVQFNYNQYSSIETNAPVETWYYLAQSYHLDYEFEKALNILNSLKDTINDDPGFINRIELQITYAKNAKEIVKTPINMVISNLGKNINSIYDEHSPVVSADETILIFTSKRESNIGKRMMDDGQYFEDIYASYKIDGEWIEAQNISDNINTPAHEASIGISVDANTIFIYRDDEGDGNIYFSEKDGLDWTVPKKLGSTINTRFRETHASLSADGQQLYFTSDRKGGYGGMDIYVVKKLPNGEWSKAQNLRPTINTAYDEEGPFIHYDGVTMFFSSQGHKSMGGFDIFSSFIDENENWSNPKNIGYPINTTDDDVFYWVTPDGRRAYYASHQSKSIGNNDIFIINLPESHVRNLTVLTGIAADIKGGILKNAEISVFDKNTGELVGTYMPDKITGEYLIILPKGKEYDISVAAEGYEESFENLSVPKESSFEETQEVISLEKVTLPKDYIINKNILFNFDKSQTTKQQNIPLQEVLTILITFLSDNPEAVIEIGSHTDSKGSEEYNQFLSEKRAGYVKSILLKNNISDKSLIIRGYGENYPIAINSLSDGSDCIEGRKFNRRVTFKLIHSGKDKITFHPVGVPDKFSIK